MAKRWTTSSTILPSSDPCEDCQENVEGGPYNLDEEPPNGLPPTRSPTPRPVVIDDTDLFNDKLQEWEDFYNFHRPHGGLDG